MPDKFVGTHKIGTVGKIYYGKKSHRGLYSCEYSARSPAERERKRERERERGLLFLRVICRFASLAPSLLKKCEFNEKTRIVKIVD
jgi:hypothetical protein